jgi:hypothetical protein
VNGVDTSVKVLLTSGNIVSGNWKQRKRYQPWHVDHQDQSSPVRTTDDGARRSVLGAESGSGSAGGQNDDGTSILLDGSRNGSQGQGLGGVGRSRSQLPELVEEGRVADRRLGEVSGLGHHADSLQGVRTLGGLSGKHDTVGTVENGVGDVRNFGSGRSRVVLKVHDAQGKSGCDFAQQTGGQSQAHGHRLQHLGGTDRGLSGQRTLRDHHLLSHKDLTGGDLDTQVTTGDHDTIGLLQDLVKVDDTLLVLDLDDDLDLGTVGSEDLPDVDNILGSSDERGKDHVDVVLDTKLKILLVLLGKSGKVDGGLGEVDTLARREGSVVHDLDLDVGALDGDDLEGKDTCRGMVTSVRVCKS